MANDILKKQEDFEDDEDEDSEEGQEDESDNDEDEGEDNGEETNEQRASRISAATKKKLYKAALSAYVLRMRFENLLKKQVGSHFNEIMRDFEQAYKKHGVPINAYDYRQDLEQILNKHHIKVSNAFSNAIRDELGDPKNNKNIQKKLEADIKGAAAQRAHLISHDITDTTRENIEDAVKKAHVNLALSDEEITNSNVANLAGDYLETSLNGRLTTIAMNETGIAVATGKNLEYETLDDTNAQFDDDEDFSDKKEKAKKVWVAILDDHTRDWHAEADGQEVPIDEPFEVGGEELMYPMDDSLGASDENIFNCRCSAETTFE